MYVSLIKKKTLHKLLIFSCDQIPANQIKASGDFYLGQGLWSFAGLIVTDIYTAIQLCKDLRPQLPGNFIFRWPITIRHERGVKEAIHIA